MVPHRRLPPRPPHALPVLAAAAVATAGLAWPAAAAPARLPARPDLVVTTLSGPPRSVPAGGAFALRDTTLNRGPGRAGPTHTRYYLTSDVRASLAARLASRTDPRSAAGDILLAGARAVPALAKGARSATAPNRAVRVGVPVGTPAGRYRVLACADDRAAARERREAPNCRPAGRPVTITATGGDELLQAMSDLTDEPTPAEDQTALQAFTQAQCRAVVPARRFTLVQAVASARGFLTRTAGADAMRAFAASPEYRDAGRAQRAAVAAVADGRPGAALAALLRAHELQPQRAAHLRNAATMAASVGLPNEALALLDGATRRQDAPLPGMGIGQHAAALAIRGQILGTLGRWADAESALRAAISAEPLLSEATAGLAATTACRQGPAAALPFARGMRTRRTPVPPVDTSRGQESPLRKAVLPGFPKQAATMRESYRAENGTLGAEVQATADRHMALDVRLQGLDRLSTRAEQRRRRAIFTRIHTAHLDPDLKAMQQQVDRLAELATRTTYDFWGNADQPYRYQDFTATAEADCEGSPDYRACFTGRMREQCRPALRIAHQTWLDQTMDTWRAADALQRAFSRRVSGYAANLADPDAFALALLAVKENEQALYGAIHGLAVGWTAGVDIFQDYCVTPDEPDTVLALEPGGEAGGESCGPLLNAMRGVFELGPAKLKISCEKVSLSGKWEAAPWLQAFAEVGFSAKTGKVTVFAGSKGEISALGVAKGAFRSGIYLTAGDRGIEDVGWRVGPSASVGKGPVEFEVYKDEIDMSFVGALDATLGR